MAFTTKWISAAGTVTLSDGNPYGIEGGMGIGGAEVRNLYERGPQQDGVSDLGYRIDPRTVTLGINFKGTSAAQLDTLRGSLQYHFAPRAALGTLQVTRDDGEVRELYARRTGPLDMPLVVANRNGNLHRTALQLFAPDPIWTEPGAGTVTFLTPSDWWLAFNTIGSVNVMEHVESPTQGQNWTYTGTVTAGSPWFIAIRSGREVPGNGTETYAYHSDTNIAESGGSSDIYLYAAGDGSGAEYQYVNGVGNIIGTSIMAAGTHNYFAIATGTTDVWYRDGVLIGSDLIHGGNALAGTVRKWRSDSQNTASSRWSNALPRAAVYNINPTPAQISALNTAMETTTSGSAYTVSFAYGGDIREYPVIRITGPISDPVLTNSTTGETLDFTGYTIGSGDYYTIDTRYGRKSVTNSGGDNKIGQLSSASDLASWHIEPAPLAAGGTNTFSLAGTAGGTATAVAIVYYNRFVSW